MKYNFCVSIHEEKRINKIMLFKNGRTWANLIIIIGSAISFLYSFIKATIEIRSDEINLTFSEYGSYSLFLLVLSSIVFGVSYYRSVTLPTKGKICTSYEYELNDDSIVLKNLNYDMEYIVNRTLVKRYYRIDDYLAIIESEVYILPNDENIKKVLNLK